MKQLERLKQISVLLCLKGLRVGDEIIEFGSINAQNFRNLRDVASVVQHSEGVCCTSKLIRFNTLHSFACTT